jgi:uncharacterized protein
MDNLTAVKEMYAAFGRRDVPALLASVDENVQWQAIIGAGSHVPTSGTRQGKQAVAEFFQILAKTVDFSRFEPREFITDGDTVVTLGEYAGRSIATGRSFQAEWAMVFNFNNNGKLVRFREYAGSNSIDAAFDK